ncbi:MAG: hypothetical protein ACRDHB_07830 [Actinomycetota bacterium]
MTEDKARKRAVRTRMAKTGERYTAARRHVAKQKPLPPRMAEPPQSEASLRRATGKGWDDWFRILDAWDGTSHSHGETTRYLGEKSGVSGWWTQSIAVGYERARGMRAKYQTARGFQVSVSKTFPVGVQGLSRTFEDARRRSRWLEAGTLKLRTGRPGQSARYDFRDGNGRVMAYFESKGRGKSTVHIQHEGLPSAETVEEMRTFWKERLGRMAGILTA